MGYARLHFANDGTLTIGNVIRDICGVISGVVTSTASLVAANTGLSEIRNSAGRGNWTQVYPATISNTIPRVLSTTCLNGQTKYIQIGATGQSRGVNNTTNTDVYQYSAGSTTQGVYMTSCTAATSATALTNQTFLNVGNSVSHMNYFTGTVLWISWSSRHCLIIGNASSDGFNNVGASGCFEFNETGIYDFRNVATFLHCQWFSGQYDTSNITPTNNISYRQGSVIILNHYRTDTAVATGTYNLTAGLSNTADHSITTTTAGSLPTSYTKNSAGATSIYLQPLFYHQHQMGIPHHYISDLSKVYKVSSGIGNNGDLLTVGADTYAYFNLTDHGTGLAVLRD